MSYIIQDVDIDYLKGYVDDPAVKNLFDEYRSWCDSCPQIHDHKCSGEDAEKCRKKKHDLLMKIYEIMDKRTFCVVTNSQYKVVRHIMQVTDNASDNLPLLKKEYYEIYAVLDGDEFHFFTGLQNAQNFACDFNFNA